MISSFAVTASLGLLLVFSPPGPTRRSQPDRQRAKNLERTIRVQSDGRTTGEIPPGMSFIPEGMFRMGVPVRDALELARGDHATFANRIVAMTPDHPVGVPALLIDQFEVTNEQFRRWLAAAQRTPSQALLDFNWNVSEHGKRVDGIPPGAERLPVRAVTFVEALACARWLGKRLPTEVEWEYAARRGRAATAFYPWGSGWQAWDPSRCADARSTMVARTAPTTLPGGSFPDDKSFDGIFDFCGNAAEWTDSPFVAYPEFDGYAGKEDKGKEHRGRPLDPGFDADLKVIRGGSAWGNEVSNSLVFRFGQGTRDAAETVGFRCAMSAIAGVDALQAALATLRLANTKAGERIDLRPTTVCAQTVVSTDPQARFCERGEHVALGVVRLVDTGPFRFRGDSVEAPALVGVLAISQPSLEPELPAGAYTVEFKAAGRPKVTTTPARERNGVPGPGGNGKRPTQPVPPANATPADTMPLDRDVLLFRDAAHELVAWAPVAARDVPQHASTLAIEAGDGKQKVHLVGCVATASRSTAIDLAFDLTFAGATFEPTPASGR
jgi:formylglycine-generating enzyme required for sulfatase activity